MENNPSGNKRIAKNTLLLYFRMLLTILVGLYTSRVVLNTLGISDYGVYNIVGGVVTMLAFLNSAIVSASQRFISFELGTGDLEKLKKVFCTSVSIHITLAILILIVAETIGLWFVNAYLNIPLDRMEAANWVYQCSVLTLILTIISVPYNSCIVAHEHMRAFAYVSIVEVILKLAIVYLLLIGDFDKLILYAILIAVVAFIIRIIYGIYCKRKFEECTYRFVIDRNLLKEMMGYACWGFLGNTAYIFNTQGVNIIINLFFGVVLNAARGIVTQVEAAVMQFVNNFTTAISPQITKSYASGNKEYMFSLICRGAKFSFFLLLLFLIPIEFEANTLLKLWLGNVPEFAPLFLQLSLIGTAMVLLGNTGFTAIMATGNIRNYQIVVTLVGCLVFPLTWIAYKLGFPAFTTYVIYIVIYGILDWIRLLFMRKLLGFKVMLFVRNVIYPILIVTVLSVIVPTVISMNMAPSVFRFIFLTVGSFITTLACIYFGGLDRNERKTVLMKLRRKISILTNK